MSAEPVRTHTLVIRPPGRSFSVGLRELWEGRELAFFLTWKTIKVRYKQTGLGIAWALVQPFFMMVVFTIFFGRLAKIPSNGLPYPIFVYTALLPWTFFATSLTQSANSLVGNASMLQKVYFPRLALPLSAVLAALVDFGLAFLILFGMMAYYGIYPDPVAVILGLPLFLALAIVTALGVGLVLAGLNVRYRDVQYTLPFLVQLWLLATPVAYPATLLDEPWRTILGVNPMAGVVEGFRWALLGQDPPGALVFVSAGIALALLAGGLVYFRRVQTLLADVI